VSALDDSESASEQAAEPRDIAYDRDRLFEEVWKEPVCEVAKRYGVSDVYLARICRKLSVPLPGRGYWAKPKERRPPRPPLSKLTPQEAFRLRHIGQRRDRNSLDFVVKS
jgi:hypothetical protein